MREDNSRRSRWEITYDVLEATLKDQNAHEGKAKKTRIMQGAQLDWRSFRPYFDFLMKRGFIESSKRGDYYYLTKKGMNLMKQFKELTDTIHRPTTT